MRSTTYSAIKQNLTESKEKEQPLDQVAIKKEECYPDYDISKLVAAFKAEQTNELYEINEQNLLHNIEFMARHFQLLINYVAAHSKTPHDLDELKAKRNTMNGYLKLVNEVKKSGSADLNVKKNFLVMRLKKLVEVTQNEIQSADLTELKEIGNPAFFNAIINIIHGELLSKIGKIEAMADSNNGASPNFDESEMKQPLSPKEIEEEYSHRLDGELLSMLGKSVPADYEQREAQKLQRLNSVNTVFRFTNTLAAKMNPSSTPKPEVKSIKSYLYKGV